MEARNINNIIEKINRVVDSHKLEHEGEYARWIWDNPKEKRKLGINEYGCADAANILYTLNRFERDPWKRAGWVKTLQSLQDSETGMFHEETHSVMHTTAHCLAALELFDAGVLYPVHDMEKYKDTACLYELLENLDWKKNPWSQSHNGAGIYVIMNLSGLADEAWNDAYFQWLWEHTDPESGLIGRDAREKDCAKHYEYMAGSFHYLFNMEYARMPLRYPEKMIDTCLWMWENRETELLENFCQRINFIQVDWIYCITRGLRQCGHRYQECMKALEEFAEVYLDYLEKIDETNDDGFNDLHLLFGCVCALAELQQALKGKIKSAKPLRLVLDRRPFI